MAKEKTTKEKALYMMPEVQAGFKGAKPLIFTNTRLIIVNAGVGDTGFNFDAKNEEELNIVREKTKEFAKETEQFYSKKAQGGKIAIFPTKKFPLELFIRLNPEDYPLTFVPYNSITEFRIGKNFVGVVTLTVVADQTYKFTTSATLDELEQTIGKLFPGKFKRS